MDASTIASDLQAFLADVTDKQAALEARVAALEAKEQAIIPAVNGLLLALQG